MAHTLPQGFEMIAAAEKNEHIVQIGSQRASSILCKNARELYHNGIIGDVEMIELSLGGNSSTGVGNIPRRRIARRRISIGAHGSTTPQKSRSIQNAPPAGAARGDMAPALAAI